MQRVFTAILKVVEAVAAVALGSLMAVVCVSITLRYLLNAPIPDAFDLSRMLLGIAVFWGIAAACGRDDYIRADLFWDALPPVLRAVVDWLGRLAILAFVAVLVWKLWDKVGDVRRTAQETAELRLPIWPFYLAAWAATVLAAAAVVSRLALAIAGGVAGYRRSQPDGSATA